MADLKLGLAQGYWGAGPNPNFVEMAQEAERLGLEPDPRQLDNDLKATGLYP